MIPDNRHTATLARCYARLLLAIYRPNLTGEKFLAALDRLEERIAR
jgi:hypothetical protein